MTANIQVNSPIDGELVGDLVAMTPEQVDEQYRQLQAAQYDWAREPLSERADLLRRMAEVIRKHTDDLAETLAQEVGKTPKEAHDEVIRTADLIEVTADTAETLKDETLKSEDFPGTPKGRVQTVTRVPYGVVLAISPFNYPVNLSMSKIAPALVMGNTVLFKPSTQGAVTAIQMIDLFRDQAGLPADLVGVVTGKSSEISDELITNEAVKVIAMTGSTEVGEKIAKQSGMVPLLMELGGNDPAIVLADADLELAAENIAKGAFKYAGQRCTAVKRVYVVDSVADELVEKIIVATKEHFGSSGNPAQHPLGPVISDKQSDYLQELLEDAKKHDGNIVHGGKHDGRVWDATIVDHVTKDARLVCEEQFGPILPIVRVKDMDEAIRLSNDTHYGLQASVFTKDKEGADHIAWELQDGGIHINGPDQRGPDNFLFIGHKDSGLGAQGIRFALEAMTKRKGIVHNKVT